MVQPCVNSQLSSSFDAGVQQGERRRGSRPHLENDGEGVKGGGVQVKGE